MSISRVQLYPTCHSELYPTCRSVERIFILTFRPGNFIGPRKIAGHVPARGCPPTTIFHYSSTLPHNISPTTIIKVRGGHRHQQRHAYSPSSRPSSSCRRWWCCTSGFYHHDQRLIVDTTTARVDTTTTTTTSWGGWSGGDRTRPDFGQPLREDLPYAVESDEFSVSRSPDQSKR